MSEDKEPFSESKLHETFDGPEITEGTQPSIKLTFYSGKLWHSDKPFPVKPDSKDYTVSALYQADTNYYHNNILPAWLSTAYEVVNPEVIPGIRKARKLVKLNPCYGFENLNDGDQITLPDGYGIKNNLQWHPVGCEGKWQNTNEYYFDTVQFPCGKRRAATITLPEKTENSAHGHTDLINKFKGKVKDLIEIRRSEHDSNFNYVHQEKVYDLIDEIFNELLSEPSESQEETRVKLKELLMSHRLKHTFEDDDLNGYPLLDKLVSNYSTSVETGEEEIDYIIEEIMEKFHITRRK